MAWEPTHDFQQGSREIPNAIYGLLCSDYVLLSCAIIKTVVSNDVAFSGRAEATVSRKRAEEHRSWVDDVQGKGNRNNRGTENQTMTFQ